jgi:RNA polymerase sigma-70 factor (ECF subfamily)
MAETPATPAPVDLASLLRAAREGDDAAWRAIIDLYARRVYALARSRLGAGRQEAAEEVTQSVFVTVASKLATPDGTGYTEQGRFESWLFRISMNRIRDEVRRQKRHAEPTDPEVLGRSIGEAPGVDADTPAQLVSLRSAMAQLSEPDREVVELRHHAGMSFKQMAELLSEPIGTLLARHHRALRKLKEIMSGPGRATTEVSSQGAIP